MCATKTVNVEATAEQAEQLRRAGAGIVRIAVDSAKDAEAVAEIRNRTGANLSVDLQENYRLAEKVAPFVDKIRYNPGHLYHHERQKPARDKVAYLVDVASENDCAIRIGVNCGSIDPERAGEFAHDSVGAMVASALEHAEMLDERGFDRFCVSLKDSDPAKVVEANRRFAERRGDVPLHLGSPRRVTAGGHHQDRIAFEQLLSQGIGDTLRVSLTLPNPRKHEEVEVGHAILEDIAAGRFRSVPKFPDDRLNIISCPS
jgi:(E)-4-hydroxy-3-methylbut-2-enyl-diphosphate synthase